MAVVVVTSMYSREEIVKAIKLVAAESAGKSPGRLSFEKKTGIKYADWFGKFWTKWNDALAEAGLDINSMNAKIPDDDLLRSLACLARELGHLPTFGEIRLRGQTDAVLPDAKVFARFGGKERLVEKLRGWCAEMHGYEDVLAMCPHKGEIQDKSEDGDPATAQGFVYLIRHGERNEYKIGCTSNPLRREGEISLELPEKVVPIHVIETDDRYGVEKYWHNRFADKRKNGEWFALSQGDIRAFRRWRRIF